jgi:hypothetical protein
VTAATLVLTILIIVNNVAWLAALTIANRTTDDALDVSGRAVVALKRANDQAASLALENDRLYKALDATDRGDA